MVEHRRTRKVRRERVRASRVLGPNQRPALTRCPPTLDNRPHLVECSSVTRCFSDRGRFYLSARRPGAGAKIRSPRGRDTPPQIYSENPTAISRSEKLLLNARSQSARCTQQSLPLRTTKPFLGRWSAQPCAINAMEPLRLSIVKFSPHSPSRA